MTCSYDPQGTELFSNILISVMFLIFAHNLLVKAEGRYLKQSPFVNIRKNAKNIKYIKNIKYVKY